MNVPGSLCGEGAEDSRLAASRAAIASANLQPLGRKQCCTCHADVSQTRRTLDLQGRFHCPACWDKRINAGTAVNLTPAALPGSPVAQRALMQALGQTALAGAPGSVSSPIFVYVAPAPGAAAERGKAAFIAGFYATAGILSALVVLSVGAIIFLAFLTEWQKHQAPTAAQASLRHETPIEQDRTGSYASGGNTAQAAPGVQLEAGVDGDSTLRVAALNKSPQLLRKVLVEVIPEHAPPMASLDLGGLNAGQLKTVFVRVPGLSQLTLSGESVRLRAVADPAEPRSEPGNPASSRLPGYPSDSSP